MTLGDPVCTRCACRFTSCACIDDRVAAEMRAIKEPSEMVRLVPEGRAERQVAAVREVLAKLDEELDRMLWSPRYEAASATLSRIRAALEVE